MALLQVIERKKLEDRVNYAAISARTGVSKASLRELYWAYKKGNIDLGPPQSMEEKKIDVRMQLARRRDLLHRYEAMVLAGLEALILKGEDDMTKPGGSKAFQELGIPAVIRDLKAVNDLLENTEKGYAAILDDAEAERRRLEKSVDPVTETKILAANDEMKALQAFQEI
jgi:hypothetical protein